MLAASGQDLDAMLLSRFGPWSVPAQRASDQSEQMFRTESGLMVPGPATPRLNPLGRVLVYLTFEDLFSQTLSLSAIVDQVRSVSLELAVAWCSSWIAKAHHPRGSQCDVDEEFVNTHLLGPVQAKVRRFMREERRVIVVTQALTVLIKIALEHCERQGPPPADANVRPLVIALLGIASHLGADVEGVAEDEVVVGVSAGRMGTYMVANQMFNNTLDWRTAWAAYYRCLRELPSEMASHPDIVSFEDAYLDATGVPLDDLVTVCAVMWARCVGSDATMPLKYFDALRWESERLEAALGLVSATPEVLKKELRADADKLGLLWSTKTFDRFPAVRWGDFVTVIHPSWVVTRSTGLWPLLDVRRELEQRGDRRTVRRVSASVEHTYELYALETIEGQTGQERLFRDDALRRAYGRRGKVADAAVDYGHSWVVVEVTTRSFQLATAAGVSEDALEQDLDDIVEKAKQVQATIDNIRRDERALTGRAAALGPRRFHPVVVVTSRFAGNPITFTMLRERLKAAEVLQAGDCAPLEVLELEDLHALEGACEKYGASFLGLLAEKAAIEHPLVPMREFLNDKYGNNAPYPERINRSWKQWMDTAIGVLRPAEEEAPTPG
ncbi:hypothetical protein CCO04_07835 [Pimelobacter sp. 30-1]|nr:hypothetical protein [Pimelobacter sp. 30-1]